VHRQQYQHDTDTAVDGLKRGPFWQVDKLGRDPPSSVMSCTPGTSSPSIGRAVSTTTLVRVR
jgi:hypothetical protein